MVQGRSDIQLILQVVKIFLSIGPILLGIFVGIYWMIWGSVVTGWICLFLNAYYSGKKFGYAWWMQLRDIAPSLIIALIMSIPVFSISYIPLSPYILLPIQMIVGIIVTIGLCELLKKDEYIQLKGIVLEYMGKIIGKK